MIEATLGDPRFFRRSGPHPLSAVTSAARGVAAEVDLLLEGVAPLQTARPNEVSFLDNRRYASALDQTLAGAVIVHPDMAARVPSTAAAIVTSEPYAAWARVAALFYPVPPPSPGIHPSAFVADGALVDLRWPRNFAQGVKWNLGLTAGMFCLRIRSEDEEASPPEPHTGL